MKMPGALAFVVMKARRIRRSEADAEFIAAIAERGFMRTPETPIQKQTATAARLTQR
jgi:hypothetical protein